jgi:hypothetical protein
MTTATDISSALTAAESIDPTFPVAGQDNNSQGFRDNFDYTQTSLTTITTVLTDLSNHTAKINADNNFNGVIVENAETRNTYGSVASNGTSLEAIDYRIAEYHRYTVGSDLTFTFSHWPVADKFAKVTIEVRSNGSAHTINFTPGVKLLKSGLTFPFTLEASASVRHVFEAWTIDGGTNVFINHVGNFS